MGHPHGLWYKLHCCFAGGRLTVNISLGRFSGGDRIVWSGDSV
ncbi:MAG: hypothetical protein WBA99_19605 [Nodosilinea sp.]